MITVYEECQIYISGEGYVLADVFIAPSTMTARCKTTPVEMPIKPRIHFNVLEIGGWFDKDAPDAVVKRPSTLVAEDWKRLGIKDGIPVLDFQLKLREEES